MSIRTASIDQQAIRTEYGTDESGRLTSVQAQVSVDGLYSTLDEESEEDNGR